MPHQEMVRQNTACISSRCEPWCARVYWLEADGVEGREVERAARCGTEPDVAEQSAYEIAKVGGRHAGLLRTYQGKSLGEIQRALRSYEGQVD